MATQRAARRKRSSKRSEEALAKKLRTAFERIADCPPRIRRQRSRDFAFHMTDWAEDLFRLAAFYSSPDDYEPREVRSILRQFLHHAPDHLVQAARLGEFFTDVFADKPIIPATGPELPPYKPAGPRGSRVRLAPGV